MPTVPLIQLPAPTSAPSFGLRQRRESSPRFDPPSLLRLATAGAVHGQGGRSAMEKNMFGKVCLAPCCGESPNGMIEVQRFLEPSCIFMRIDKHTNEHRIGQESEWSRVPVIFAAKSPPLFQRMGFGKFGQLEEKPRLFSSFLALASHLLGTSAFRRRPMRIKNHPERYGFPFGATCISFGMKKKDPDTRWCCLVFMASSGQCRLAMKTIADFNHELF